MSTGNPLGSILFVIPRNKSRIGSGTDIPYYPHLGVASLIAYVRKHGHRAEVFDAGLFNGYLGLDEVVKRINPAVIGVTAYSYSYSYVLEAIDLLKSITNIPIVMGGAHVTATKKEILQNSRADFGVMGEGELTLIQLVDALLCKSSDFSDIRGLIWRKEDNIVENEPQSLIQNLDSLPPPDLEAFELGRYPCISRMSLPFSTERGCPYTCTYCSMRKTGFRARTPEVVVEELQYWVNKGFKHFDFNDDVFNFDIRRAMTVCDLIIERKLNLQYELYNGIRADRVTIDLLQKLKKSGCVFISYGLESGNADTLTRIQKKITLSQLRQAAEWTKQSRIPFSVNFIVGHPGETLRTAMDSVRFAESLPATWVNFYNLVPFPGTPAFEWVGEHGRFLIPKNSYLFEVSYRDNRPVFETEEFTAIDRTHVVKAGTNLYNKGALRYRFGKVLGTLLHILLSSHILSQLGGSIFAKTTWGQRFYMTSKGQTQTLIKTIFFGDKDYSNENNQET